MRTTLTIDDQLMDELKKTAVEHGKPLKDVLNEMLRMGLKASRQKERQLYKLEPQSLGSPFQGLDLGKARQLADELEDEAIVLTLKQHK